MSWQDSFQAKTLEKGYRYFDYDQISDYSHNEDELKAIVHGTQDYHVKININHLKESTCSCGKEYCKHMAGVLYCLEEENQEAYIDSMVEALDEKQVKELMKYILKRFPNVYDSVFDSDDNDSEALYQIIESDEDFEDLDDYLDSLSDLINLGFYEQVFDKLCQILSKVNKDPELNEDEAYHLVFCCLELINSIIASPIENSLINKIKAWIDFEKRYYNEKYGIILTKEIVFDE